MDARPITCIENKLEEYTQQLSEADKEIYGTCKCRCGAYVHSLQPTQDNEYFR
jgi:hypothetical protein